MVIVWTEVLDGDGRVVVQDLEAHEGSLPARAASGIEVQGHMVLVGENCAVRTHIIPYAGGSSSSAPQPGVGAESHEDDLAGKLQRWRDEGLI